MKPLKSAIDRMIDWGNGLPASPWQLAAIFAATVIVRNLMEALALGIVFDAPAFLLHFPVAYVFPLMTLVFFMHVFSGYETGKLLKIMVLAWTLTLLPPIIDAFSGHGSDIGYFPLERSNAAWFLLNFFNPAVTLTGTTTGIRIEAAIGCILAGVFTWAVAPNRRLLRGLLNTLVFAPVFLTFFTWPYLVTILFQPLFPGDGLTHSLLQWHAATEPPVTGASHYTTYLIDMLPVSLLSLWFLKELAVNEWNALKSKARSLAAHGLSAAAGTMAAIAVMPGNGTTFADIVKVFGAFFACLWITAGTAWKGSHRAVASAAGLTLAWAVGWETLVLAGFAMVAGGLPGPDWFRRALFSVSLFAAALSPSGFTLASPAAAAAVVSLALLSRICRDRPARLALYALPVILVMMFPLRSTQTAWQRSLARRTDTFARSGRVSLAMESASRLAASGGSWLTLAETTHLSGMDARSRYLTETMVARGDSSAPIMKVAMNLAFARSDSAAFERYYGIFIRSADPSEISSAVTMRVTLMGLTGDTQALNQVHAMAGMNPMLLRSMAIAHISNGDTLSSLRYSLAFLESPAAAADDWARAISLAAATGQADWDSLYRQAEEKLGLNMSVMLARVKAPLMAGIMPDRKDLLERCLLLKPDANQVLETAALWHAFAQQPESSLVYASRAIAGSLFPSPSLFHLAVEGALKSGNIPEATASARYAVYSYPSNLYFRAVLAATLEASGEENALWPVAGNPEATLLRDSLLAVLCGEV